MSSCRICLKPFTTKQVKIPCADCGQSFHGTCVQPKITKKDVESLAAENLAWRCDACKNERSRSLRFEAKADEGSLTLADVMKAIQQLADKQKTSVDEFNTSFEVLNDRLEENTTALTSQTHKIEEYLKTIEELAKKNKALEEKCARLEERLEEAEQYSRRNCVEIHGVPEDAQETTADTMSIVQKVGQAVGMEISASMIDACHRLGRRRNNIEPRGIVVKFVRRLDKDALLDKRREKRQLSTRHMGLHVDKPVYVNESLTPERRRLFSMARQARREKNFKFLWHRGGKIFLRKEENGPVILIGCQADLGRL